MLLGVRGQGGSQPSSLSIALAHLQLLEPVDHHYNNEVAFSKKTEIWGGKPAFPWRMGARALAQTMGHTEGNVWSYALPSGSVLALLCRSCTCGCNGTKQRCAVNT